MSIPAASAAASVAEEEASQEAERSRCLAQGRALLREMNPTPAVCGDPRDVTFAIIGDIEGFDRWACLGGGSHLLLVLVV